MKTHIAFVLALFVLAGCASETENKALQSIASHYSCSVSFSKGVAASTSEGSKKYFELKLTGGGYLDSLTAEESASYSALTLYQSLSPQEKESYTHIKTVVEQQADGGKRTTAYEFTLEKLKTIDTKLARVRQVQDHLKQHQYEQLVSQVSPLALQNFDQKVFFTQLDTITKECGEIQDYQLRGFNYFDASVGNEQLSLLRVSGVLLSSNKNVRFNVILSPLPEDNQVYGVNFN